MRYQNQKVVLVEITFVCEGTCLNFEGTPDQWNDLALTFFKRKIPNDLPTILKLAATQLEKGTIKCSIV